MDRIAVYDPALCMLGRPSFEFFDEFERDVAAGDYSHAMTVMGRGVYPDDAAAKLPFGVAELFGKALLHIPVGRRLAELLPTTVDEIKRIHDHDGPASDFAPITADVLKGRRFTERPELLRVFNQGNQATGEQSRALAASVVAYAVQLIDPAAPSFAHVLERIAYKHISLGIRPEQYTIVGHHLLAAVGEVLGDAVTPEIADAWIEVYWLFATQLNAEEARLYQQAGVDPARPLRPYRVVRRIEETQDVISLILEPADDGALPEISPEDSTCRCMSLRRSQRADG